jgi:hypothetical protein
MADKMSRTWKAFLERDRQGQGILFDDLDFPDSRNSGYTKIDGLIWNLLSKPCELKYLLVKLIEHYGIAYSESELKKICHKLCEEKKIIIERNPPLTPKGRRATSFDYKKYRIVLKRG